MNCFYILNLILLQSIQGQWQGNKQIKRKQTRPRNQNKGNQFRQNRGNINQQNRRNKRRKNTQQNKGNQPIQNNQNKRNQNNQQNKGNHIQLGVNRNLKGLFDAPTDNGMFEFEGTPTNNGMFGFGGQQGGENIVKLIPNCRASFQVCQDMKITMLQVEKLLQSVLILQQQITISVEILDFCKEKMIVKMQ